MVPDLDSFLTFPTDPSQVLIQICSILFYSNILYYITVHYITLHFITLHFITLHYIILYYIISYHIITPTICNIKLTNWHFFIHCFGCRGHCLVHIVWIFSRITTYYHQSSYPNSWWSGLIPNDGHWHYYRQSCNGTINISVLIIMAGFIMIMIISIFIGHSIEKPLSWTWSNAWPVFVSIDICNYLRFFFNSIFNEF